MKIFKIDELLKLAKQQSPYYAHLYKDVLDLSALSNVPIVDQASFWDANSSKNNRLFTENQVAGIAFKSGGTTSNPKFSVYSRSEWDAFCRIFGEGMNLAGMEANDRVANLFYVGELYASFIFIMKCIELAPTGTLQFPIAGSTKPEIVWKTIEEFQINLVAGLPTTILALAEFYEQNRKLFQCVRVTKILFGGESMYPDQRNRLEQIFPGVKIGSIGYASVDAGLIGYSDPSCAIDEHRCFAKSTVLEIVDEETFEPILDKGIPGKILLTNLTRSFMPIIRYPVGDRAQWSEDIPNAPIDNTDRARTEACRCKKQGFSSLDQSKNNEAQSNFLCCIHDRKYQILGRSEEAARVGPVSVYYDDMRSVLDALDLSIVISSFQLIIDHAELKDRLTLRLAVAEQSEEIRSDAAEKIRRAFAQARKMYADALSEGKIHEIKIDWISTDLLETNQRTGKLKRVIDRRS